MNQPDFIFESSWEVCNKVGGIYTVLSTKAKTLTELVGDGMIFLGPLFDRKPAGDDFLEEPGLYSEWTADLLEEEGVFVRTGRWDVPGKPLVFLIDFAPLMQRRNDIYAKMWEWFGVDSLNAYGDYDESCVFAYSVGRVIESYYHYYQLESKKVVAAFNEWMLGMGALYVQKMLPQVGTLYTTHATTVGRSIASNNKSLYAYMEGYFGDQMAKELNVQAKHSVEKTAAHCVDCFTTVSTITARECEQLLDKMPDVVTPNGFESNFVPVGDTYTAKRRDARKLLIRVAEKLAGKPIGDNAFIVCTSGRYEYRNKGLDVFIEAMRRLSMDKLPRELIAYILVPADVREARSDLQKTLELDSQLNQPMQLPYLTHWLNRMENDLIVRQITDDELDKAAKLNIIFVPCYLDGSDGIFNRDYYDLLIGTDATVFPSYYEPWGYTPLESIAFGVPTITTSLAGFGLWAREAGEAYAGAVDVIDRDDFNYFDVASAIERKLQHLMAESREEYAALQERCRQLSKQAEWKNFITDYRQAYDLALSKAAERYG